MAINIFTHASSQQDGKTGWACFIAEEDLIIQGRLPDHTPITLAELHAIHAALAWRESQSRSEPTVIHSDSMAALTILITTNFHTYPEITSKIFKLASVLQHSRRHVTLHWVPSHLNLEGNEKADTLPMEAISLDLIQHAEQTRATYSQSPGNIRPSKPTQIHLCRR